MNALLLLACATIGPITETEGIGIRHCHADDRAVIEVQPVHPSPNRVGGWFTTTNHTLFLRDLSMIPNGTNIMRVRTICGGATGEVSEVQFVIHRAVPAPMVGLVRTFSPSVPLPPGLVPALPGGTNRDASYAAYRQRVESGKRRSE